MKVDEILQRIEKVTGLDKLPDQLVILSKLHKVIGDDDFEEALKDKKVWQQALKLFYESFASSRIYKYAAKELLNSENVDNIVKSRKETVKYQKAPDAYYVSDVYLSMARLQNISPRETDAKYWEIFVTLIHLGENQSTAFMATSALLKKCGLSGDRKEYLAHILSKLSDPDFVIEINPLEEFLPIVEDYLQGKLSLTENLGMMSNRASESISETIEEARESVSKKHIEKKKAGKSKAIINPAKLMHGWIIAVAIIIANIVLWQFKLGNFTKFLHILAILAAITSVVYDKILRNKVIGMLLLLTSILLTVCCIGSLTSAIFKFINYKIIGGWKWILLQLKNLFSIFRFQK